MKHNNISISKNTQCFMHLCSFDENGTNISVTVYLFKTKCSLVVIIRTFKTISKMHTKHTQELFYFK